MRLWSIHPRYLDRQGLIALWREALLAQKVLVGKTKGYRNHPQLIRFRESSDALQSIGFYLFHVAEEASVREYRFDTTKILKVSTDRQKIQVTQGQVKYEAEHLLRKLKTRDQSRYIKWKNLKQFETHPLFKVVKGDIQVWEKIIKE